MGGQFDSTWLPARTPHGVGAHRACGGPNAIKNNTHPKNITALPPFPVFTRFLAPGPILSHVVYSGVSADGAIHMEATAHLLQTDAFVKVVHRVRCRVLKDTVATRLAFYQFGTDSYNYNPVHDGVAYNDGTSTTTRFVPDSAFTAGTAAGYEPRAVQFHPHGGQSDLAWLPARTPHGVYVW